jgi:hypothetical protein
MIQSIEDGRREAGDRSIADKIIKRLHDLEKPLKIIKVAGLGNFCKMRRIA